MNLGKESVEEHFDFIHFSSFYLAAVNWEFEFAGVYLAGEIGRTAELIIDNVIKIRSNIFAGIFVVNKIFIIYLKLHVEIF